MLLACQNRGIQKKFYEDSANRHMFQLEKTLQQELHTILHQEELMWFQRSRAAWMHDGDRNTKYYQIKAANRKRKNCMHVLRNEQGRWIEDESSTKDHVTVFFKSPLN